MVEEGLKLDKWGYSVKTHSDRCISSINAYYDQVLSCGRKRSVIMDAASADSHCVLANVLAAYFLASSDPSRAPVFLSAAKSAYDRATDYEKAVFDAVSYLMSHDKDDDVAIDIHAKLLKDFPRDLSSLKRAQLLCFYSGQPNRFLDLVNQVRSVNEQVSYYNGMLSFALLELGKMEEAQEAAKMALEINKEDVWAQHCLCHVLQHRCCFREAVRFMEGCSKTWGSCSSFMYTHNWWHVALCYLEGHSATEKILEVYDQHIVNELEKSDAAYAEVFVNALGLMLRLHVRGQIGLFDSRLKTLVSPLSVGESWHVEWQLDLLTLWALQSVGEHDAAEDLLEGLRCKVSRIKTKKKRQLMQKALLLAAALYEYGGGNNERALALIGLDFDARNYKMIGASDEQLDVFNEVWYCLLLNNGHSRKAIDAIEKRIKEREGVPFLWRLLEKGYKMAGKEEEVLCASNEANRLESAYFK